MNMDMIPVDRTTAERWRLGGDDAVVLAGAEQTGGALLAVEVRMPPGGGPPVMHRHAPGEIFHVLEGELVFYVGDPVRRVTAAAGDVVPLAGGVPHTVRNESDADAVVFVVHAPAAPMEAFGRAAAAAAVHGDPSLDEVLALAEAHGVELLGPVPAVR